MCLDSICPLKESYYRHVVFLGLVVIVTVLITMSIVFVLRELPLGKDCRSQIKDFTPIGIWLSETDKENQKFIFIESKFAAYNTIGNKSYIGTWKYVEDSLIALEFQYLDDALVEYLRSVLGKTATDEKYKELDPESGKLRLVIQYDKYNCGLSNTYFYFGEFAYRKQQYVDPATQHQNAIQIESFENAKILLNEINQLQPDNPF